MNYLFELRKDKINKNGMIPIRVVITSGKIKVRKNLSSVKTLLEDWDIKSEVIRNNKKNPFFEIYQVANADIQQTKEKRTKTLDDFSTLIHFSIKSCLWLF